MRIACACFVGVAWAYHHYQAKAEERRLHRRTYERLMDAVHMAR